MIKKVCAITVSQNYLERKKYSIKFLSVGKRVTNTPFWFVRHTGETNTDRDMLEDKDVLNIVGRKEGGKEDNF